MKELSVFVDESGDFGEYDYHSLFYIISLVFHDQVYDISSDLAHLENSLNNIGWAKHCIHAGPIIRSEEEYRGVTLDERRKILKNLIAFTRHINIFFKSIYIEKKHTSDSVEVAGLLSKQLSRFIKDNMLYFNQFDVVKIYYDNGQIEVTRILSSVFNSLLDNVEFKRVIPSNYRLFQVADLICTLKLTELKMQNHILSKSEIAFFENERCLKKNYLKIINHKNIIQKWNSSSTPSSWLHLAEIIFA